MIPTDSQLLPIEVEWAQQEERNFRARMARRFDLASDQDRKRRLLKGVFYARWPVSRKFTAFYGSSK